ncbi:hypothetical protein EMPS_07603 [Entomortierella parvispora]|uniref:Uncharacterized protein n=1 Tax=Entomortierella parvispora TaxID=205924 RepID=A0A9P3HET0_9FUNG|nr:hypothetical protein EMPS_07603 [Entomortierella parvispora]
MAHIQDEIRPSSASSTSSHSSTSTSASSASSSGSCNKSVQFSRFIKISFTYPGDEYDRSALEPAKLTFSEASELLELRCHWRKQMSERLAQQQLQQQESDDSDNSEDDGELQEQDRMPCCCESHDSDYSDNEDVNNNNITVHINRLKSSSSSPCLQISTASPTEAGAPNSPPSPQQQRLGRHSHRSHHRHLHSLLHPTHSTSSGLLFTSPPCSPLLSPQDSCSNSSSEDEYDHTLSPQHPLSFSSGSSSQQQLQQQQQQQRLKRFGGSRDGLMHRHSHLDQSKVNVQCIAIA